MANTPISTFTLYRVPFDPSFSNVTDFESEAQRDAYFANLPHSAPHFNAQYIRKNAPYNVPLNFDFCDGYNYIVYDNNEGKGKQYAFIIAKRFLNFETTEITLSLDVWQTYLFSWRLNPTEIIRRHCDRYDSMGLPNFTDAMLPDGGYNADIISDVEHVFQVSDGIVWACLVFDPKDVQGDYPATNFSTYSQIYIPVDVNDSTHAFTVPTGTPEEPVFEFLDTLASLMQKAEYPNMFALYLVPYAPFKYTRTGDVISPDPETMQYWRCSFNTSLTDLTTVTGVGFKVPNKEVYNEIKSFHVDPLNISPADLDPNNPRQYGLEPKVLCYPYDYYVAEIGGSSFIIKNEMRSSPVDDALNIYIRTGVELGGVVTSVRVMGLLTDISGENTEISNTSTATFGLRSDAMKEYMLNNSTQLVLSNALTIGNMATAFAGGDAVGGLKGITSLAQTGASFADLMNRPQSPKGSSFSASAELATKGFGGIIKVSHFTLNDATRRVLTDKFTRYGYNLNRVETPVLRRRYWFDYIKTSGIKVDNIGSLEDEIKVEAIFDKGVTVWHCNGSNLAIRPYGDITLENVERSLV